MYCTHTYMCTVHVQYTCMYVYSMYVCIVVLYNVRTVHVHVCMYLLILLYGFYFIRQCHFIINALYIIAMYMY